MLAANDEAKYWDRIAESGQDNIWKRGEIVKRLLSLNLIDKKVLEIGVGLGVAAAALHVTYLGSWHYKGTDISAENCAWAKRVFNLDVVQADITALPYPDKSFDAVILLDVLEHISPAKRPTGYKEVRRVLKNTSAVALHIPLEESLHEDAFEFYFTQKDLSDFYDACGLSPMIYEVYEVLIRRERVIRYAWAVGVK